MLIGWGRLDSKVMNVHSQISHHFCLGFPVPIVLVTLGVSFMDYFNSQNQL